MKKTKDLTPADEKLIQEMYQARFSITETSQVTGYGRHVIVKQFNKCKTASLPVHDRSSLLSPSMQKRYYRYIKTANEAREAFWTDVKRNYHQIRRVSV